MLTHEDDGLAHFLHNYIAEPIVKGVKRDGEYEYSYHTS